MRADPAGAMSRVLVVRHCTLKKKRVALAVKPQSESATEGVRGNSTNGLNLARRATWRQYRVLT
eukprot:3122345-Prymnesium_polylepis.1